jgi:hypothetical protein
VEVGALDLGRDQEPLRLLAEEQDRRVGQLPVVEQVQVLQQLVRRRVPGEGKPAGLSRRADEPSHALRVQVIERRLGARGGVEGAGADRLLPLQVFHQRRVQSRHQLRGAAEPFPDQTRLAPGDEGAHLGVAG